ncbi:class D beta-lactamase [Chitinibacter sp. ZOR0017]|uniref:class D beta-lactamase n=1 Tax=Chitinibacter sp. ZOR0017 TaxID=1339254 RepID=UPI00064883A9|nr:class D beta-lactamase [Chitinibacter sp. ZOR0017]
MYKFITGIALGLLANLALAAIPLKEDPRLVTAMQGAAGVIVVQDVASNRWLTNDLARAQQRFSPASTFKIPHSLIGLHAGAVASVDEVFFHYRGEPVFLPSWGQDMSLRQAIKVSNVLAYQTLARRIGPTQMQAALTELNYGNAKIGKAIDQFWLGQGALQISASEQVQFLSRLAQGQLPYPAAQQAAVREISLLENTAGWQLYGKTGWTGSQQPSIGWQVGWLTQGGQLYVYALNMDTPPGTDLAARPARVKASLRALGLLEGIPTK